MTRSLAVLLPKSSPQKADSMSERDQCSISGVGVGLRHEHLSDILAHQPAVPWFEVLVDNWLSEGGLDRSAILGMAERYPLAFHGVNLNLGGLDPLDMTYLARIKTLMQDCQAAHYSEHACFSRYENDYLFDLCPLPYTQESARHLAMRVEQVQDFLGEAMLIENVSSYFEYQSSALDEADFLVEVSQQSGCKLLLDINNVYVNAVNHGFDVTEYLQRIPQQLVAEIHLSGHDRKTGYLLDTHGTPVTDEVWRWDHYAIKRYGYVPSLIEWDHNLPEWQILEAERVKAERLWQ